MRKFGFGLALLLTISVVFSARAQAPDSPDLDAIYKLKDEGFNHSQVMEIESYLTDVYGPRLTNSPNVRAAADWTTGKLKEWQLTNVHLEPWSFGRGWSSERFSAQMIAPRPFILIAYPKAWTPGTNGPVTADAVLALIEKEEDLEKFKGQLKGKFVLTAKPQPILPRFEADAHRYTEAELAEMSSQTVPVPQPPDERAATFRAQRELQQKVQKFLVDEGVAAWIETQRGDDGTVFVQQGGSRDPKDPPAPPRVALAAEHYGRIYRLLQKKIPVTLEINIDNKFYDDDPNSFDILGEIPGTDKKDEVVMLGAHFDSWQAGTGATDNGAGSAVMLEAVRILKASGLPMRRTVRIGLWTGEEQGLLGSRAYVKEHFADPAIMKLLPEHAKLDAYYNVDNGTGKIRGVYLQGNEAVAPIFTQWMAPFRNLGMTTLTIRNTGGTDHLSFNAVGLPGFQFIQDTMDYDTRTHHSNMDVYERVQEADMKQMSVIVASFVYMTANRPAMLPRKPLPPPQPPRPQPN
ncbi:MAG TPA: M20/M25/M40 family metallo-hydrolase [Candidatus Acidoferrales bacterium]|nr:M20/M25/M40 family metallo-hydrolase [Candidatus Acidoferrales bacterium]